MEYRTLPRGGERISVIGLGGGYIGEGGEKETSRPWSWLSAGASTILTWLCQRQSPLPRTERL